MKKAKIYYQLPMLTESELQHLHDFLIYGKTYRSGGIMGDCADRIISMIRDLIPPIKANKFGYVDSTYDGQRGMEQYHPDYFEISTIEMNEHDDIKTDCSEPFEEMDYKPTFENVFQGEYK